MNDFRLEGKVALVTGGASGIGEATCRIFAAAGAKVVIADINAGQAEQLSGELPDARAIGCDITDEASVDRLFSQIPKLDVLVNCAGIGLVGNITETALSDWQRLFRVNVDGMFLATKASLPLLLA